MIVHIDYAPLPNCHSDETYGAICVKCNQCGRFLDKCYICGKPAKALCDYSPAGVEGTCNKQMCRKHAHSIGVDTDACTEHYNDVGMQKAKKNREAIKEHEGAED